MNIDIYVIIFDRLPAEETLMHVKNLKGYGK